ncbi:hypothetical protein KEJ15_06800 [Candidatus Bathyarchaeota archaeon]|nr:hypothetical protein [Candidatus Bathyarchaeota archaeon]
MSETKGKMCPLIRQECPGESCAFYTRWSLMRGTPTGCILLNYLIVKR